MNAEAIVTVSAAVVALTQLVKWGGVPDRWGPLAVLLLAALGVGAWTYSQNAAGLPREELFGYFAGWISVATSAAGIYGFTRAGAEAVTRATAPPAGGAGSERTTTESKPKRRKPRRTLADAEREIALRGIDGPRP